MGRPEKGLAEAHEKPRRLAEGLPTKTLEDFALPSGPLPEAWQTPGRLPGRPPEAWQTSGRPHLLKRIY